MESDTIEQVVTYLEGELELSAFVAPDERQMNKKTQRATKPNSEQPKPACHHCKNPGHYTNQGRQLKPEEQTERNTNSTKIKNSGATNSSPNDNSNRSDKRQKTVYPPYETCARQSTIRRNATL